MKKTRELTEQIEIQAPIAAVWKALTEAEELTRWFPLEAKVTPGTGGSIWMSWRNEYQFEWRIDEWIPNRHLRTGYEQPMLLQENLRTGSPQPMVVDYHLESRGNKTVLRLVHSGFSLHSNWDELYDGTRRGWQTCLWILQHYLEHHLGKPRDMIYLRNIIPRLSREESWHRLVSACGGENALGGQKPGRYCIRAGECTLEGIVKALHPPKDFTGTVENLNHALLRIHFDDLFGRRDVSFELCTYGLPTEQIQTIEKEWARLLNHIFETE